MGDFFCVCQKYAPSSEVPLLALYIVALAVPLSIELYHAALSRNFLLSKKNYMRGWYKVKVEKKLKELLLL